jgi:hypothetical protein
MATTTVFGINPALTNGDFEAGDVTFGWNTGGTRNHSVTRVPVGSGQGALVAVGAGPVGDASCTNPGQANFAYLDQRFRIATDRVVQLDFLVPVPSTEDPTENATCPGFDRIELDFVIEGSTVAQTKALGVVLIDYFPSVGYKGHVQVNDVVISTVDSRSFDPVAFSPVTIGPLTLTNSPTPGWLRASFEVSTTHFPWLSATEVFRVTVRNEDNRFTGRHFSVTADNVVARPK